MDPLKIKLDKRAGLVYFNNMTNDNNTNQITRLSAAQVFAAAKVTAATPQRTSNDVLALNNMPLNEQKAYRDVLRGSLKHCIICPHDRAIDERHLAILDALLG